MKKSKYDIFISYSRKDSAIANSICKILDAVGITYFIDRSEMVGADGVSEALSEAILSSRIILFLASENAYKSKFTLCEINFAFNEKESGSILPYIIDGSTLPANLRFLFSGINWRDIRNHPIDTILVKDLCKHLGKSPRRVSKDAKAIFEEALNQFENGADSEATIMIKEAARLGYADAQYRLGMIYEGIGGAVRDYGVSSDYEEAYKWYKTAADQGHVDAMVKLGSFIEGHGREIGRDVSEVVKWYRQAADLGSAKGLWALGSVYTLGTGVPKDYKEALKWYLRAAEMDTHYQIEVGLLYQEGFVVPLDLETAFKWFLKAAQNGDTFAQYLVGNRYEKGQGVARNLSQALKWYHKAAENNEQSAQIRLGKLFFKGEDVEPDLGVALKWFQKVAETGDKEAALYVRRIKKLLSTQN